ncbi:Transcription factor [Nymphaea thermarum]|nr:Transcription factor [Nymphaea thermarum]
MRRASDEEKLRINKALRLKHMDVLSKYGEDMAWGVGIAIATAVLAASLVFPAFYLMPSSPMAWHVGHLLSPMEAKQPARSFSAENETQKKRRRPRSLKNSQELEKQRMTHITVERNRRKQMNEHLAVLRSLMPESYIQRGDQASIVGGAIDFVKELEQLVQSLEVQKSETNKRRGTGESLPFASFFTCPQYSFTANRLAGEPSSEDSPALADIQVAMSETYASLKVLTLRKPGQLLRTVAGLQGLRLTVLHLNVTTTEPFVLYSFSTKVEEDCKLNTADEIASAVHQMLVIREAALMGGFNAKSEEHL